MIFSMGMPSILQLFVVIAANFLLLGFVDAFALHSASWNQIQQSTSSCLYSNNDGSAGEGSGTTATTGKERLISYISSLNSDANRLPCGIEGTDQEKEIVVELVADCLSSPVNRIFSSGGQIKTKDILGEWELLFTTSRTFSINKSLSGLGRSESDNAKFASLRQKFSGSQFLGFVEFVEKLGTGGNGLDVIISGEWMFEPGVDSFTGLPVTAIRADLQSVEYGPSKNNAEDWSSLGPVKLLDVVYIDDDLHISRSKVKEDTIFIYHKV